MRKPLLYLICFLLAVFMIGSAIAADKVIVKQITGDVVTIDVAVKTLTVRGKKAEVVITADDKTIVKMNKEKKTLSDIKVGDKVTLKYAEIEGNRIARSIEIKTATTEKKGAEPAKPAKSAPKSGY
jgi:Cu/Ag efflux protein CusF